MFLLNFEFIYRVEKNGPRARASLRLPGTGERERRGNTEPFEGLFSRPDTGLNFRLPAEIAAGRGRFPAANEN